jgi:hypothetical protein
MPAPAWIHFSHQPCSNLPSANSQQLSIYFLSTKSQLIYRTSDPQPLELLGSGEEKETLHVPTLSFLQDQLFFDQWRVLGWSQGVCTATVLTFNDGRSRKPSKQDDLDSLVVLEMKHRWDSGPAQNGARVIRRYCLARCLGTSPNLPRN